MLLLVRVAAAAVMDGRNETRCVEQCYLIANLFVLGCPLVLAGQKMNMALQAR